MQRESRKVRGLSLRQIRVQAPVVRLTVINVE